MGGSGSVDQRRIRWYLGAAGTRHGHCSCCRVDPAGRIRGLGGRPNPPWAPGRTHHLVRPTHWGVTHPFLLYGCLRTADQGNTRMVNCWVAVWPLLSATRTVNVKVPAVVGVPLTGAGEACTERPGGRVPAICDQV